jgi:CO/xanthine dehydrogenase FAD-binding subunit
MKNYQKAESLEQAYELNQKKTNAILGGLMWMKMSTRNIMTGIDLSGLGLDTIEETDDAFSIGCMCTLRQLETNERLQEYFGGVMKECTRHIVGTQFRNCATVGGSVFGRFGFSDILTCLMALDTEVELYSKGVIPLAEFAEMPYDRDILVRVWVKKDGRKAAYQSHRESATDFPVIACGVSCLDDTWKISVGARSARAKVYEVTKPAAALATEEEVRAFASEAADQFRYGTNMRGSAEYRRHLAEVYIRRAIQKVLEEGGKTVC